MLHRRALVQTTLLAFLCLCCARPAALAQTNASPLPAPTGHVNDFANVIDPAAEERLETILTNLKTVGQIEFAVVTVGTTGGQDIFDYSLAVARGWGVGAKDGDRAGLLLLVAVRDRKYFTQTSRHVEGDLPDGLLGQIQRARLVPPFREGNYSKGITDTAETYVATLAQSRGFSVEGIDQSRAYRPTASSGRTRGSRPAVAGGLSTLCCVGIVILFVVIMLISKLGRRGGGGGGWGGGGGGGLLNALILGSLLNSATSGRGSSGWGGGSFGGGGWGGGGGGGGGFGGFGGGGDFGGGGSGGSW